MGNKLKHLILCQLLVSLPLGAQHEVPYEIVGGNTSQNYKENKFAQDQIVKDLYIEMFIHLENADTYLRNMINCFAKNPLTRPGQEKPMYNDFTSCEDLREEFSHEVPKSFMEMRVNLALIHAVNPTQRTRALLEKNPETSKNFPVESVPVHRFQGLSPMDPLNQDELKAIDEVLQKDIRAFNDDYNKISPLKKNMERHQPTSQPYIYYFENQDRQSRARFLVQRHAETRTRFLKNYNDILTAHPFLGFMPRNLQPNSEEEISRADSEMLITSFYALLTNNCLTRTMKFSRHYATRATAEAYCKNYISSLKESETNRMSLPMQDKLASAYAGHLDREKPTKEELKRPAEIQNRFETLSIFGLHKSFVEGYRNRSAKKPEVVRQFDSLKNQYEILESVEFQKEIAMYVGIGGLCMFGLSRVPFLTTLLVRFGMPLCLFSTGLPLNTVFWFYGFSDYMNRFNEVFSQGPYQQALQEVKAMESAQTAIAINSIMLLVGTETGQLARAAKTWFRVTQ